MNVWGVGGHCASKERKLRISVKSHWELELEKLLTGIRCRGLFKYSEFETEEL